MADTTLLRTSAIVQNATAGVSKPPLVSTGALSQVQVKMTPAGPQVQEGQQRPVQILPPRDAKSALQTGGLPMVQVKMTGNGPQLDDGQNRSVVIKDGRPSGVNAGSLPMVQVKMTGNGPQVQTLSNVHGGPPQIPAATPVLSAPRGARAAAPRQVYPRQLAQAQVQAHTAPQGPELSIDQLMLCRHLVDKYLGEQRTGDGTAETVADNVKLAEDTIFVIDQACAAATEQVTSEVVTADLLDAPAEIPVVRATGYVAPAAYTPLGSPVMARPAPARPAPARGFVAPRPGGGRRVGNVSLTPRRVARVGGPLPMVQVKMDGQRAVVQNQAEVAAIKAAQLAEIEALVQAQAPAPAAPQVAEGAVQG